MRPSGDAILDDDDEPMVGPERPCGGQDQAIVYDEDGDLTLALAAFDPAPADTASSPCPVKRLDGSWFIHILPRGAHSNRAIRGAMRIEASPSRIRISGDIYVDSGVFSPGLGPAAQPLEPITASPLIIGKNWYPQFPHDQYSWYFRSVGVRYQTGALTFKFQRRVWDPLTQEFAATDTGSMKLVCGNTFNHPSLPQPTIQMAGTAIIGGEPFNIVARKTSTRYRGCDVEIDVMQNRSFPMNAQTCAGAALTFTNIYGTAGWDCRTRISQTNIPDDANLTTPELQAALTTFRDPAAGPSWRLWLFVGSAQGGIFGLMFDDTAPHREGTAGFFDPRFSNDAVIEVSARGQKLGDVPAAFLRTLVHEAGHAFNLFHPKHDVHTVPIGTTIMNQTGDVIGFATTSNPYPCNVTFGFDEHSRTSLVHSPDPQVAPGRKPFGWGHGDLSSGVPAPVDVAGLVRSLPPASGLVLTVDLPDTVFRGEFVAARFTVTNTSAVVQRVTAAINLAQGDLRLRVTPPGRAPLDVRDRIVACGDRSYLDLAPGASIQSVAQVFYTSIGRTFRHTGRYYVSAELDTGGAGTIESEPVEIVVRAPITDAERSVSLLMMDEGVARSVALGDFGATDAARARLEVLADRYGATTSGAAAALVLANSYARPLRNLRTGKVARKAEPARARKALDIAARACSAHLLVDLAVAVVAPTDGDAPLLKDVAAESAKAARRGRPTRGRRARRASAPALDASPAARLEEMRRTLAR